MSDDNVNIRGMSVKFTPVEKMVFGVPLDQVEQPDPNKELMYVLDSVSINETADGAIRVGFHDVCYITHNVEFVSASKRNATAEAIEQALDHEPPVDPDDPELTGECDHAPEKLMFDGYLGAPGFGKSYSCQCGEALWGVQAETAVPFKDLDESDFIMSPEDCI